MAEKIKKAIIKESGKRAKVSGSKYDKFETLQIDETLYKTLFNVKYLKRTSFIKPDPQMVLAVIPGTVIKILVKKGQTIEPGEAIVIIEAMKMMNRIILPLGGKIKKINVREGERIPKKHLIAELE
jgi:biotin carboxyl carrier protein